MVTVPVSLNWDLFKHVGLALQWEINYKNVLAAVPAGWALCVAAKFI